MVAIVTFVVAVGGGVKGCAVWGDRGSRTVRLRGGDGKERFLAGWSSASGVVGEGGPSRRVSFAPPPSNDAGGAAPPSSEPLPPSSAPAPDGPGTYVAPDGATLDATTDSDNKCDKGDYATPLRGRPKLQTARINRNAHLFFCNDANAPPPDVRFCDTPNESDYLQDLTSDKIYHLFGNRRFRN